MGIPSYFSHIVKQYGSILEKFNKSFAVQHLFLDSNSIIYDVIRNIDVNPNVKKIDYETKVIRLVCEKIKYYIDLINPSTSVFIAFDGVAPVAKLEQQRTRRYKNSYLETYEKNKISSVDISTNEKKIYEWDRASITPGTNFMTMLNNQAEEYFKYYYKNKKLDVEVSTSACEGEGEHKIFEYIRKYPNKYERGNCVIYGLDADLIMLTINHLTIVPNIYLFRETPEFIKSIDKTLDPNSLYMMNIPLFKDKLIDYLNEGINEITEDYQKNIIHDYIFISFMLGNDFLPHFPALNIRTNGLDTLMECYKNTIAKNGMNLTNGKKIYWKNLRKLIMELGKNEEDYILHEHKMRDKHEKRIVDKEEILNFPLVYREIEKFINPFEEYWQTRYYSMCFQEKMDEEEIKKCCYNYLEGLEWTFKYYTHKCVDWRWKYNYHYPPLLQDLCKYVPYFEEDLLEQKEKEPIRDIAQLCYVLPSKSHHLLPSSIEKELQKNFQQYYNSNAEFLWPYCRYFWESHIELPDINVNDLQMMVDRIIPLNHK